MKQHRKEVWQNGQATAIDNSDSCTGGDNTHTVQKRPKTDKS